MRNLQLCKYSLMAMAIILLTSSGVIVVPFTENVETGQVASTQGTVSYALVTITSLPPSAMSLSINHVSKTSSGLGYGEHASNSQPYYAGLSSISTTVPGLWLSLSKRKRRARSQIYIEILELMKERGPMTPFEMALYARLNHKRAQECVNFLNLCNYLQQAGEEDGRVSYELTKDGLKFLVRAEALFRGDKLITNEI